MVVVAALCLSPASAGAEPPPAIDRATIALVPSGVTTSAMADAGMAVGWVSAGHGIRTPAQTFLDIGQGARVSDSLYDEDLPGVIRIGPDGVDPRQWERIIERAESAPGDVVPGLLAEALGGDAMADPRAGLGQLIAADREGRLQRTIQTLTLAGDAPAAWLGVTRAAATELPALAGQASPHHLVIALAVPRARGQRLIAAGFVGAGFEGVLESQTTRLDGLVSAIDIAPTILELGGRDLPGEMDGRVIGSDPDGGQEAVADLGRRLLELSPRRTPVVWANAGIWVLLTGLACVAFGPAGRRLAVPWLAASMAILPAMLLVGAALQPSEIAERLIVGLGGPALAFGLLRLAGPYGAFAIAAAVSVGGYAVDVVLGSELTALTVGGSNPSSGVRYFGIGNEHEAALSALTLAGIGSGVAAWAPDLDARRAVALFAGLSIAAVLAFAPGRFGADVGAAITIPAGAAVAVAAMVGASRRGWLLVLLAPVAGLGALIAIDLGSGGDAHFTRSVLDAEDSGAVADVLETRLRLAWGSFERNAASPFLWTALALLAAAFLARRRLRELIAEAPRPALAGLAGAIGAIGIGTAANDSGITLFVIGIWFVIPFAAMMAVLAPAAEDESAVRG